MIWNLEYIFIAYSFIPLLEKEFSKNYIEFRIHIHCKILLNVHIHNFSNTIYSEIMFAMKILQFLHK